MKQFASLALSVLLLAPQQLFGTTQSKKISYVSKTQKILLTVGTCAVAAAAWKLYQSDKSPDIVLNNDTDDDDNASLAANPGGNDTKCNQSESDISFGTQVVSAGSSDEEAPL